MYNRHIRVGLVLALAAVAITGTTVSANADDSTLPSDDAYTFDPNEAGLVQLYGEAEPGTVQPMNFTSHMSNWKPGNKESSHWADNDYTEIQFTGCSVSGPGGSSVTVKLWQAIPFSQDKDMGNKTFTACFNGSTSRGEWSAHYDGGDNRYFTVPYINGSSSITGSLAVSKVYVDTSKAD